MVEGDLIQPGRAQLQFTRVKQCKSCLDKDGQLGESMQELGHRTLSSVVSSTKSVYLLLQSTDPGINTIVGIIGIRHILWCNYAIVWRAFGNGFL